MTVISVIFYSIMIYLWITFGNKIDKELNEYKKKSEFLEESSKVLAQFIYEKGYSVELKQDEEGKVQLYYQEVKKGEDKNE